MSNQNRIPLLELQDLSFNWDDNVVLRNISLNTGSARRIGLAGESGSGKSSLLKLIAGLLDVKGGIILFRNEQVAGPALQLIPGHKSISYVSQDFKLRNNYRVWEELDYTNMMSDEDARRIFQLCRIDHLLGRWTDEISGGEQQRIALARAMISEPSMLLLDEPYSNLDMFHKQLMKQVVEELQSAWQLSCILVSHDPQDLLSWAEYVYILQNGQLVDEGDPRRVYTLPLNTYTAGLFGVFNVVDKATCKYFPTRGLVSGRIIRPSSFAVSVEEKPGAVKAIVQSTKYFGSHVELEVLLDEGLSLLVFDSSMHWQKGDAAFVRLL